MKIVSGFYMGGALVWLTVICGALTAGAQTVNVWLTTDDQAAELQPQTPVVFSTGAGGGNPVFVDETQTYQQIEGFGAAFTDTTGYVLNEVATPAARNAAMTNLFTRGGGGIGLSFMRNPMGASDLARYDYSYDDNPPGGTDTNLIYFSIAHDQADIIPLIRQALQLNPQLKLMANPWSPPGWMKDSGSMIGGSLLPGMYGPFADYFVKYIQAYAAAGIPINYISLQNEPLYEPADYPGMYMDAATQLVVLRDYVLPAFASNHITARVLVYDHNWDRPDYPETVLSDPVVLASSQVAGTAWHGYAGTPGAMFALAGQYPAKGNYETEHSGGAWVGDQVRSDFEEITHVLRSWGRTYVKWNLAADQNDGPNTGGCNTCSPLVTVNTNTGAISYDIDFYTLGQFSKFVLPGAYRIYSGNASGIVSAAFLNPDGSKALVAFNDTPDSRSFQIQWGNKQTSYSLPGFAGATFTWAGTQNGGYTVVATNQIQASSFNSVYGLETEPTTDMLGGYDVGYADDSYYAVCQNMDFATGITNITARVASASSGGTLEFRLDSPTGPLISSVAITNTGGWQTWQTVTAPVSGANGRHNLYLVFHGTTSGIGNLNWFQFGGAFNHPPVLAAITNQTILAGATLVITNSAGDADVPPQTLTFSLLEAPPGAVIDPNSGVFTWRPAIAQSPSLQPISVAVSDNGVPVLSATQSFTVTVMQPVHPTLNAALMSNARFEFWINGDTGPDYTIQVSTNLVLWSSLATANSPALPFTWNDTNAVRFNTRFYRVLLGP
ncbi:MAG TPA: carbohydrate-binding protein [Candidatus Sulfopaludibacter sp.]|nr:carbohydrate-binding protein [Candidatus Sulfopaludibacter sp.]